MCIILSLTENYYFIKISAHLHYVRKLLEFKVLWECRCCADFRGEGKSSSTGCSFFFMISPLSIMILMVSLQSTNGIFVIWHYEEHRFSVERIRFTDKWDLYLSAQCLHESKHVDIQ